MPELAEVAWYARQWDPGIGKRVVRTHVNARARVFRGEDAAAFQSLCGRRLLRTETHGKQMLFVFSDGCWLGGHLGMTGELLAAPPPHEPEKHDHLVLHMEDAALVFRDPRMFGRWRLHTGAEPPEWWAVLPPQINSPQFTVAIVEQFLKRHARSPLKALLLDQAAFPGVGNWMADEAMWQLQLHPATPAGGVDAAALHRALRLITRTALKTIGRDWSDPPRTWLFQHRWKAGGQCPRCAAELERGALRGRTACWCPVCQPAER